MQSSTAKAQATIEQACHACGTRNRVPLSRLREDPKCGKCQEKIFPHRPVIVDDRSFGREVEAAAIPVLVDFWAPWCAPCRMIAPSLEALAQEHGGRLKIVKFNVDDNPHTAGRFGIRSIPALKLFVKGEVVQDLVGAMPKAQIWQKIARFID